MGLLPKHPGYASILFCFFYIFFLSFFLSIFLLFQKNASELITFFFLPSTDVSKGRRDIGEVGVNTYKRKEKDRLILMLSDNFSNIQSTSICEGLVP